MERSWRNAFRGGLGHIHYTCTVCNISIFTRKNNRHTKGERTCIGGINFKVGRFKNYNRQSKYYTMRKSFQTIILFLFIIFITACSVGKKYQRPTVQLPQQFDNTAPSDSSV